MAIFLVTNRKIKNGTWTYFRTDNGEVTLAKWKNNGTGVSDFDKRTSVAGALGEMAREACDIAQNHAPLLVAFVHGYNNTLDDAMARTIALQKGLEASGVWAVMVCFAWPSDGKLPNYLNDRDDARLSFPAVVNVLDALTTRTNLRGGACNVNVCVVAHSMGSLVVREGFARFAARVGSPAHLPLLAETVLVAPDIDSDSLQVGGSGAAINALSRRVTVYYNRWDNVLALSQYHKNGGSGRLGRSGPTDYALLDRKVVAVNASEIIRPRNVAGPVSAASEADQEAHSGYFGNALFYTDLAHTLLSADRAVIPTRRPNQPGATNSYLLHPPT